MIRTLALVALLTLAACGDDAEQAAPAEAAAVTEDTGFGGDVAAATRHAAADVEAAAREAGSMDAPVTRRPAPTQPPEAPAEEAEAEPATE
ncbi:hypothetical protein ACFOMD_11360 [Sphingoaurantiacus capsulatus]|uniref:Lipoprotein n=1 Tax=Sphingoaurantiacus capsulatus TaxID=1771310 RepID=A0ABV7XES7_9SPHN